MGDTMTCPLCLNRMSSFRDAVWECFFCGVTSGSERAAPPGLDQPSATVNGLGATPW
jgi:hypothetical protein